MKTYEITFSTVHQKLKRLRIGGTSERDARLRFLKFVLNKCGLEAVELHEIREVS